MGGVEDEEPASKRMKLACGELRGLSNGSSLTETVVGPPRDLMARPLQSEGDEDVVGSKGVIKRVEFVRIIAKALDSLGYKKSSAHLEEESGIPLHSSAVNLFMQQILDGNWDESVATLHSIGLKDENIVKSASFLILEQKFFELLEREKIMDALKTLRTEIAHLCINSSRIRELSSCIVSPSLCASVGSSNQGNARMKSRSKLLEELQKLLPPTVIIPERRLEYLVEQALTLQRDACIFHNSSDKGMSLYTDHQCGRDQIPSRTLQGQLITQAVSIPVIGDGDNGYGNAMNVKRTIKGFIKAGFAGILLEDQVSPKACGHTRGRKVVSREEAVMRIKAAVDAREETGSDIVIVARTDSRQAISLDESLWRSRAFADAGADVLFIDALTSREEMKSFCEVAPQVPKMANMLEGGGKTPILSPSELEELGYKVVVYPLSLIGVAIQAMQDSLIAIKGGRIPPPGTMPTFEEIKEILGFNTYYEEEKRYATSTS